MQDGEKLTMTEQEIFDYIKAMEEGYERAYKVKNTALHSPNEDN